MAGIGDGGISDRDGGMEERRDREWMDGGMEG